MPNNEYLVTNSELTATANSIREKLGSQAAIRWAAGTGFKSSVDEIQTGGGGGESKYVKFYDYDGTIVYSYTPQEFANLSAMPDNPTHTGLTAQGWNWTLADAKTYVENYGELNIGQMYITDDGKTRIHIRLEDGRLDPSFGLAVDGSADIDWGDGTAHSTLTGSSTSTVVYAEHSYASAGEYTIAIDITGTAAIARISTINVYANSVIAIFIGNRLFLNGGAFSGCYSLASITIPSSVTSIGGATFGNCYSLANITIPSSVTSIGNNAFSSCYSLASITIPSSVTSIANSAFNSCYSLTSITIPSGVTNIGSNAFQHCFALTSITIPSGVTNINDNTFSNCYSLASIIIPSGVASISYNAFGNCYTLASITIPSSVTNIGNGAFSYCYSLTSVTIPSGVTRIYGNTFTYCYSLASITIPSSVTRIDSSAFSNCYSLASITIPSGVTSIANGVFNYCRSLTSITIPSSVTSIGAGAFQNCSSLASITIPSGVTSIGDSAFNNCYSFTSITIPSSVTSIANSAFRYCQGLSFVKFLKSTPPTCSGSAVWTSIPTDCQVIYPYASTVAYKSATNYPSTSTYLYLGFYAGTDGETLPTTVTDGTTTYNLTWYANTKDAVAETNPITTMQGTEVYCRSVLAA